MNVLDYRQARPSRRRRMVLRLTLWATAAIVFYFSLDFVPTYHRRIAYICQICARTESASEWGVFRIPYRRGRAVVSTDDSDIYDKLISTAHTHQWENHAIVSEHGNLWGYFSIGEGGPTQHAVAICDALHAMAGDFADLPLEQRRAIYAELLKCQTPEEVQAAIVAQTAKAAKRR